MELDCWTPRDRLCVRIYDNGQSTEKMSTAISKDHSAVCMRYYKRQAHRRRRVRRVRYVRRQDA